MLYLSEKTDNWNEGLNPGADFRHASHISVPQPL